jgi:thiamine-monophosphate kinase
MSAEFQLIRNFLKPFARKGRGLILGPGDDCAVLRPAPRTELCVTTDALVERVHFDPACFSDEDVGHKALAVNLSDLAAMGAAPRWFLCSISCSNSDTARIPGIARGMARLARRAGIALAGGNFTRADALSIHITALGEVPLGAALTRSGARPGDVILVTGTLGDAALGLAARGAKRSGSRVLLRRQLRPEPRLQVGLMARGVAHAAIDISDGLLQDLSHVLRASRVGARIDARSIPLSRAFRDRSASLDLALTGGEDYELALFLPAAKASRFEQACYAAGHPITRIGETTRGRRLTVSHAPPLVSLGFDHFQGREPRAKRLAPSRQGS